MLIPDYEKLYGPYAGKASLEETFTWLKKRASKLGIDEEVMNKAINDTFLEMAEGKTFPVDGSGTGFPNIPHAVLNHYLLKKMILFQSISMKAYREATEGLIKTRMLAHISTVNKEYIKANMKVNRLLDWSKSPIVNLYQRIVKKWTT